MVHLNFFHLFGLYCLIVSVKGWFYGRPDPGLMTRGEVWPLPMNVTTFNNFTHVINPATFQFTTQLNCDILQQAFIRYKKLTFPGYAQFKEQVLKQKSLKATLTQLSVQVTKGCDSGYPQMGMDESYTIQLNPTSTSAVLKANEVWGALRGLESFSQMVFKDSNNNDLMAQNKMNVFHWHLTDSEAFPYASKRFPDLSAKGAYTPRHVYTQSQIQDIIAYARLRGIRVVPEFDTPGHTGAWGPGMPGLLSLCYDENGQNTILSNLIDPTKDANWDFLTQFFDEALNLFPDNYMHFGGDEVEYYMLWCWYRNSGIMNWMQQHGMGNDTTKLLNYFFQKLVPLVKAARSNTTMIFWQEVLDLGVAPPSSIAHVWKGDTYDEVMSEMYQVTAAGHYAILSSCWYLNYIKYGADWGYVDNSEIKQRGMYYECDPTAFGGSQAQNDLVLGGEAVLWSEFVDGTNLIPRLWPRASAVAERLWSDQAQTQSADAAWPRLHEHKCRMMARGYPVEPPNDPDYCPDYWDPSYPDLS